MMRTWLARGTAVAVTTLVVGAWALGLASGKDDPPQDRGTAPAAPESSATPEEAPSVMGEREDRPRKPGASPSSVVPAAETTDAADAADDPVTDDEPRNDDPGTPKPSPRPSGTPRPSPSDKPTKTPSPTPTEADCKDLGEVLDCVLAPITTRP